MPLLPDNILDESFGNISSVNQTETPLPNNYSFLSVICISTLVIIIIILIVFGNLLVVIAIATDRNLKLIQNWFIASLAVADFLLGLIIMPFSLANELMGYWIFGPIWCDLWKSIDVFLCTASILSICLISLDRYWSVTRALEYARQRTPRRAALMITAVWFLSAVTCIPPLIGWKNPLPVTDYPLCLLSDATGYVIYSTMGSFYIPAVIMVFVYVKIYLAAKARARRHGKARPKPAAKNTKDKKNNFVVPPTVVISKGNEKDEIKNTSPPVSDDESNWPIYEKQVMEMKGTQDCKQLDEKTKFNKNTQSETAETNKVSPEVHYVGSCDSEEDSGIQLTTVTHVSSNENKNHNNEETKKFSLREMERQKRKVAKARERRATLVLGLVMAAFILCWCPFFTLYIASSLCNFCIPNTIFAVFFWAGYCNSALNPIIYTIFNRDFRQAFHKIITRNIFCFRSY
ncbi:hypothetical protein KUTeg_005416 [Tegillarca granosa]|uniref:G-protein coupled receptors family 1 profile domain-containing protein n=1 Tax=Tegillarca granosa TaxID=220873 RepID=A0ABQ9FJM0_TEGGR|nr:hypothetical protein KUTeg_005416 [Tegillarca granosa]